MDSALPQPANRERNENPERLELEDFAMSCFLCQQQFLDIDELQQHLLTHPVELKDSDTATRVSECLNCDVCGRSLRSQQELQEHHKRYHATHVTRRDNEAECKHCDDMYGYYYLEYLERQNNWVIALESQPKRKYPPRSPFFNPNLSLESDAYI